MRCIYCLEDSGAAKSVAHVISEGIGQNDMVLPKGAVCDACNHYIGHELESVLVAHPIISIAIQTLHLRGKGGKRRKKLGNVDRTIEKNGITIPCEPPVATTRDGVRRSTIRPLVDPSFDFQRFRRGLHHVALNVVAYQDSVDRALDSSYDPIRSYVKRPKKGESWPFLQKVWPLLDTDTDVKLGLNVVDGSEVAGMKILCGAFFVALANPAVLRTVVDQSPELQLDHIDADYRPAKQPKPGKKRYRVTIYVDE